MALKITVSGSDPMQLSTDVLAIGVTEGSPRSRKYGALVAAINGAKKLLDRNEFSGKAGQLVEIAGGDKVKAAHVLFIGLGDGADGPALRRFAAAAARRALALKAHSLAVVPPDGATNPEGPLAEGTVLGAYRFEQFKTGERVGKHPLEKASLVVDKPSAAGRAAADRGQRVAEAVCIARDLINMPPNELYPETLAGYAKDVAQRYKDAGLRCSVLTPAQIKQKGMNLLEAVGRGSTQGPRLIHLTYKPAKVAKGAKLKRLVFVGKGLTFDTGGVCIKPAPGMEEMKGDMGGAANVVALMAAVAETQPQAEIHGIIPSAENMCDGNAYRPGDIFKSYQGKTVEIINTDAEGRLALADALHYAVELEPDFLLDNATLTGACVVALGQTVSAFYSNRDELAETMKAASKRAGEAMWHMPLVEDLREKLKSEWADLKHVGDRWGGSITAALFLREFVGDTPWVHIDIAGPSMADKPYDVYAKGGTGHGVLTYLELIDHLIAS